MRKCAVVFSVLALFALSVGSSAAAGAAGSAAGSFDAQTTTSRMGAIVSGRALALSVAGLRLTLGQTGGGLSAQSSRSVRRTPVFDQSILIPCSKPGALDVAGSKLCVSRSALGSRVALTRSDDSVDLDVLERAGLVRFQDESSVKVDGASAGGDAIGFLTDAVSGSATCSMDQPEVSKAGLTLPSNTVLSASAGFASCSVKSDAGFPVLAQRSGVTELALTVNQAVVASPAQVQDTLSAIQGRLAALPDAVRAPIDTVLGKVRADIGSAPLLKISLGPTESGIRSRAMSIDAGSESSAVHIDVLAGLATVDVSSAAASAKSGTGAEANADPAMVRVRVLDLSGAGGYITATIAPSQIPSLPASVPGVIEATGEGVKILAGTALETVVSAGRASKCVVSSSKTCESGGARFDALASASGVSVNAFRAPLPQVSATLAEAQAGVYRAAVAASEQGRVPLLARTGAPWQAAVSGGVLALAGLGSRRRLRGGRRRPR